MLPKPPLWLRLLLLFALAAGAQRADGPRAPARTREEIYLEVFKHPPPDLPISSYVRVVLDGTAERKVPAILPPGHTEPRLEGASVLALLRPTVQPEVLRQLAQGIDAQGWLDAGALTAAGFAVSFDPGRFRFSIATAPALRGTTIHEFVPLPPDPLSVEAVRPAGISGFLNLNLKGATRAVQAGGAGGRQTDAAFAADGALNVHGVVFEGSAYGQAGSWQRGDLRLVHDRPRHALRFTAGDLNYPVVGYQAMVNLLGVGVAKDFALQPHVPSWRTNQFEFYLERPAEVRVWMNESLVNTLQLPAGAHDLRNLNAAVGQNDVRLEIEDAAGRRDLLEFSFLFNPVLLPKGRQLFSYNAGFRRELRDSGYHYDLDRPMFSGSYLAGWTDDTTLGGYLQADRTQALLGLKVLQTFRFGTVQFDAAASRTQPGPWDAAGRLELSTDSSSRRGLPGVRSQVALEYLGRDFGPFASPAASRATLAVRGSLVVPLGRRTTGRLNGVYTPARRAGTIDAYHASAALVHRWGRHVIASLAVRHRQTSQRRADTDVLFGISVNFSRGIANFHAAKELESDAVSARYDSGRPINGTAPYGFVSTRVNPDQREYMAGAGYWGNHGLAELAHTRAEYDPGTGWLVRDETALRLQTALVFADGTFALARPVIENFVIVTGTEGLADVGMKIDPDGRGGSRARSDWLGPAVVEDLPSYRLRDLRVEPVDPPLGATPEKTAFTVAPTYKSGVLLRLGREPQIVAVGRLVDESHAPLAHCAIDIQPLDRPGGPPVSTFTSRSGMFQVPDARPGRYEIRLAEPGHAAVVVELPSTAEDLHRLGEVVMPRP